MSDVAFVDIILNHGYIFFTIYQNMRGVICGEAQDSTVEQGDLK